MNKVEFSGEVARFFHKITSTVVTEEGNEYCHYPFWLKKTDDPYIFEVYGFDELPDDLREFIQAERDRFKVHYNEKNPMTPEDCIEDVE